MRIVGIEDNVVYCSDEASGMRIIDTASTFGLRYPIPVGILIAYTPFRSNLSGSYTSRVRLNCYFGEGRGHNDTIPSAWVP